VAYHRRLYAAAAALWLAAAGCTTGKNGANGGKEQGSGSSNVVRQVMIVEPATLDPALAPDIYTGLMVSHSFEGLTRFNDQNQIEPALAEKWDVSPDGKVYTFHLRKGVKFHNGRAFEAGDVKYSWERALSPATASPQASTYLDGIVGLKAVMAGTSKELSGVKVLDPGTLQVTIDKPRAYFTGMLSMPQDYIVCKEAVEKTGGKVTAESYVGTGPFKFSNYKPGQEIAFDAFAEYWGGKPACDRVELPIILDKQTAYDNYLTGKVDVFPNMPGLRYSLDRDAGKLKDQYHVSPVCSFNYLGMEENRQPAFKNVNVRRAIAYAINRDDIARLAYRGVATVATGALPTGMPMAGPTPPALTYNPEKAKQLLAAAGYPGGKGFPAITLSFVQKDPDIEATATIIRRNLHDNLGIEVTLQAREAGEYFKAEDKHEMEMWYGGWVADYLDPQDFLSVLYLSDAGLNWPEFKNAEFDALCHEADSNLDTNKRSELYGKANAMIMDQFPVVPLVNNPRISLVSPKLKGWRENMLYILPNSGTSKH
jgi:oligopeptide transport system substrate-binding protein